MTTHTLKTWPAPFAAVLDGSKTHEVRVNDRDYQVGDVLELREWEPGDWFFDDDGYTDRRIRVVVTHLTPGGAFGLPDDLCVMSIRKEQP